MQCETTTTSLNELFTYVQGTYITLLLVSSNIKDLITATAKGTFVNITETFCWSSLFLAIKRNFRYVQDRKDKNLFKKCSEF